MQYAGKWPAVVRYDDDFREGVRWYELLTLFKPRSTRRNTKFEFEVLDLEVGYRPEPLVSGDQRRIPNRHANRQLRVRTRGMVAVRTGTSSALRSRDEHREPITPGPDGREGWPASGGLDRSRTESAAPAWPPGAASPGDPSGCFRAGSPAPCAEAAHPHSSLWPYRGDIENRP